MARKISAMDKSYLNSDNSVKLLGNGVDKKSIFSLEQYHTLKF